MLPVISFIGSHNSGKTTALCRVIDILAQRGIRISVLKHSHHELTIAGSEDSERIFAAGAQMVYASSPGMNIVYRRHEQEKPIDQILAEMDADSDCIIVEGYKQAAYPKIEFLRKEINTHRLEVDNVIAFVSDFSIDESDRPCFSFEQMEDLALYIVSVLNLNG